MFIAMNRFKVNIGKETEFEALWRNRDSKLSELPGFESFHLLRGETNEKEGYTLYSSHTVWRSKEDFTFWTKSEQFRSSHRNAGANKSLYMSAPQFEGFEAVEGV
ncbi:antibiotic biosynthesis monooxygenase family protein [Falsochrobactrum ovis]|uniref:Heme-degrading monooxygenase HmoA n=1 Tax=Falsochrobactrum ovis TaxID=1293442 RepID=A0A364JT54_9HYPH|nr:antibiotic biosynthesis monooxygenase [Falsochrobactrum ovis]RAK26786.1 heme-degrading monooxygenase HmoA [Falsochrobactrum ovis]